MSYTLFPSKSEPKKHWGSLIGCALPYNLAQIVKEYQQDKLVVVIAPDIVASENLAHDLEFFLNIRYDTKSDIGILNFPDWETLPFDSFSPHQDIISRRLAALYKLLQNPKGVLIIPISTLMHKLCPKDFISKYMFMLKVGQTLDLNILKQNLTLSGYHAVSEVNEHGEFAVRGSIIDLYPMGSDEPYRIDLFDDEIDSIRLFDVESQKSSEKISSINLLPAKEFPFNEESISLFRNNFRDKFNIDPTNCDIYNDVSYGIMPAGIEYYLPLFFETELQNLFSYIPENSVIVNVENIENQAQDFWQEINRRYDQYAHDIRKPIVNVKDLYLNFEEISQLKNNFLQITLSSNAVNDNAARKNLNYSPIQSVESKSKINFREIFNGLECKSEKILLCTESLGRQEIILDLLSKEDIHPEILETWDDFLELDKSKNKYAVIVSALEFGAIFNEHKFSIITENQIFGQRVRQTRRRKSKTVSIESEVLNLAELKVGELVVHIDHGIGKYLGLQSLSLSTGVKTEFVTLEYANNSKLYLPVSSLHLISRYSASNIENATVHALGNDKWSKEKKKALSKVKDVAAELLDVYAKREAKKGVKFDKPNTEYEEFVAKFPFEETIDQERAIADIVKDMTNPRAMDRVVCGDVGFGKTEVAMRAAFLAVQSNKQVAVLVPTTLLADQHFQTFTDRFAGFPVNIAVLSRFVSASKQKDTIDKIKAGKVDIIIGTHKLIQGNIKFKDLGLLIIDEEHRFGVKQKEKFKAYRSEIDILTLTATPIPRTLSMAMSKIRDLSIIATPPQKRLSVKTFVRKYEDNVIAEAIDREIRRGGQVYFLHNSVDTIQKAGRNISKILPTAKVAVAHGQMPERELEKIMIDFYHRKYNVLVCTTIIETGIDIPTANTIIMERADKLGLAQLHQLRGRVGRSHHQAYAFCLVPPEGKITSDAKKRLEAIQSLDTLGAGFSLASHDLEIRGAGELLGEEQSGNIDTVGFSLYMELIEKTVELLKQGKTISLEESLSTSTVVDLQIPNLIPENYINDVHTRLVFYKRIANAKNHDELGHLKIELLDRFGRVPEYTLNLFDITSIKLTAEELGVQKIKLGSSSGEMEFISKPKVSLQKLVDLVNKNPDRYKFKGPNKLGFYVNMTDADKRVEFVAELLSKLS